MNPYIIAADIGGSHISSMLLNRENWDINTASVLTTKTDSFGSKTSIIQAWTTNLLQTAASIPEDFPLQIAIALPGPFDYEKGVFQRHPKGKMGSLANKNFQSLIAPFFPKKAVFAFENDAACYGLGEACFGQSKAYQKSIGITLGTGLGSSFIADNHIIKSHSAIPKGGELYAEPYRQGIADDYFSTRWFVQKAKQDLGLQFSGVRELTERASNDYLDSIFNQFTQNLYAFLLSYAQKFGAEIIVIGGNITKTWRLFGTPLQALFQQQNIAVLPTELNEKAIMLGAAKVFEAKDLMNEI